jgi:hypothetical protein
MEGYPTTFTELLKGLPGRAVALIWKVVSIQGLVLVLATWLTYEKKLDGYGWIVTCCFVLFGRYALDVIKEIKR